MYYNFNQTLFDPQSQIINIEKETITGEEYINPHLPNKGWGFPSHLTKDNYIHMYVCFLILFVFVFVGSFNE